MHAKSCFDPSKVPAMFRLQRLLTRKRYFGSNVLQQKARVTIASVQLFGIVSPNGISKVLRLTPVMSRASFAVTLVLCHPGPELTNQTRQMVYCERSRGAHVPMWPMRRMTGRVTCVDRPSLVLVHWQQSNPSSWSSIF
jgi:hypothetical protein